MSIGTRNATEPPPTGQRLAYFGLLVLLVAATYGHVATAFFVADDYNILHIVATAANLHEATGIAANWEFFRPLTAVTYWATYLLCGLNATAFHLFDLLCHAGNAFLVAWLAWLVLPHRLGAAFAGACFAVFPTGAECVTWIAGRFDVLCVTGALLCLTGFLRVQRGAGTGAVACAVGGLVIGLLAKDTGMILPLFLICLTLVPDHPDWPVPRRSWRLLVILLGLGAVYLAVRIAVLDGFGGYRENGATRHLTLDPLNAVRFVRDAVHSVLAPGTHWTLAAASCGLGAALLAGGLRGAVRRLLPLVVCFGVALVPAANTVHLVMTTGEGARFLYLPSAFACAGLGVLLAQALQRRHAATFGVLAVLLLGSYATTLVTINQRWRVAGDTAATIVAQLRELTAGHGYRYLFIHDLPDAYQGAFIFRTGIERALRLFVDHRIEFPANGRISRADWDKHAARRRADPGYYPEALMVRWEPGRRRFVLP